MKNEHPPTVNAKDNARNIKFGNKLNVLKVNQEKLIIRIQERNKFMVRLGSFKYLDENRVKPNMRKLMFIENTAF
jgi:hypothetical protein